MRVPTSHRNSAAYLLIGTLFACGLVFLALFDLLNRVFVTLSLIVFGLLLCRIVVGRHAEVWFERLSRRVATIEAQVYIILFVIAAITATVIAVLSNR